MVDFGNSSSEVAAAEKVRGRSKFIPAKYFYIKSHLNGFVMDIEGGKKHGVVKMYPKTKEDSQKWRWDGDEIVSKLGWALTVYNARINEHGQHLDVADAVGKDWTRWKMIGGNMIANKKSNLVLSVWNDGTSAGEKVVIWPAHDASSQQWELEGVV